MESIIRNGTTIIEMPKEEIRINKTTGINGTTITKSGKIRLEVTYKGKKHYMGLFETIEEARKMKEIADEKEKEGTFLEWYEIIAYKKKAKYGVPGLTYRSDRKRFYLQVSFKDKSYTIGSFVNAEDAAPLRKEAEIHIKDGTFLEWHEELLKKRKGKYGVKGLTYYKSREKYYLEISYKGKKYTIGSFENPDDAIPIYNESEKHKNDGTFEEWYMELKEKRKNERKNSKNN